MKLNYHIGKYTTNEHSVVQPIITIAPIKHPVIFSFPSPPTYTLTSPLAITPQNPLMPCTENASSGSSTFIYLRNLVDATNRQPDTTPISSDHHELAASHPAVMPTSPASSPFESDDTHSMWSNAMIRMNTVSPPAAADRVVFMQTTWMATELLPVAPSADPPLKPYHPNHRIRVPKTTIPTLCGLNSSSAVSESNLPILGPKNIAPISPHTAPNMCTMPDPAKSVYPIPASHPSAAHVQCTTTGYMNAVSSALTTTYAPR